MSHLEPGLHVPPHPDTPSGRDEDSAPVNVHGTPAAARAQPKAKVVQAAREDGQQNKGEPGAPEVHIHEPKDALQRFNSSTKATVMSPGAELRELWGSLKRSDAGAMESKVRLWYRGGNGTHFAGSKLVNEGVLPSRSVALNLEAKRFCICTQPQPHMVVSHTRNHSKLRSTLGTPPGPPPRAPPPPPGPPPQQACL